MLFVFRGKSNARHNCTLADIDHSDSSNSLFNGWDPDQRIRGGAGGGGAAERIKCCFKANRNTADVASQYPQSRFIHFYHQCHDDKDGFRNHTRLYGSRILDLGNRCICDQCHQLAAEFFHWSQGKRRFYSPPSSQAPWQAEPEQQRHN